MVKKDFIKLAEQIRLLGMDLSRQGFIRFVYSVAEVYKSKNKNFDKQKFFKACGL